MSDSRNGSRKWRLKGPERLAWVVAFAWNTVVLSSGSSGMIVLGARHLPALSRFVFVGSGLK